MTAPHTAPIRWLGVPVPAALHPLHAQAAAHWHRLSRRERLGVQLAGASVALLLVIMVGLAPALRTLRTAPAQQAAQQAQLLHMQQQAAEAQALRAVAPIAPDQAQQALKAATEHLGPGSSVDIQSGRARVTLQEVEGDALRRYLAEARSTARARPVEAQLQRGPRGYNGSLILQLGEGL